MLSQAYNTLNTSTSALNQLSTGLRINTAADDAAGLAQQQRRGGRELGECARVIYRALDDVLSKRQTPLAQANVLNQLSTGLRINSAADDAAGLAQQQQGDGRLPYGAGDRELGQCAGVLNQVLDRVLTLTAHNPLAQANAFNRLSTGLRINSADDHAAGLAQQQRRDERLHYGAWGLDLGQRARVNYQVLTSTAPNPFAPAGAVVTTSDTYNTSLSSSGLISNTTYYFQVAALNNDGAITAYTEAQGTSTLASPPSSPIFATVSANSVTASWTSPTGGSAAGYVLQASTAANFTGTVYSSATSNAALGTLTVSGLWANTTYFFQLASLNWNSIPSYAVWGGSTATLASPPTRLASDYIAVYYTSATLQWAALPLSPSSRTCEGYLLIASTVPDFSGTIISSATSNPALSTLTISGLNLANTYYFQVGSLNPDSVWNPVSLTQLSMQLSQSTAALSLGALDPNVYLSTISISSFVVTNQGSLPVTIVVWASTMTQPSSPWSLGQAPDVEMVLLQGLWSPTMPASGQFNTAITNSVTTSTALSYAGNQTGVSVPPGQSRTMWFQFWRPTTTVTNAKQAIQISAQAIYP